MKEHLLFHKGMSDASAAVHLSKHRFLVASDSGNVFQIYDADESGKYLQEIPFASVIELDANELDIDVEACARVGDLTFWMSSHSRGDNGTYAPERQRFFAARLKGKKRVRLQQFGCTYTRLLLDLLTKTQIGVWTDERMQDAAIPELENTKRSVNIEGLSIYESGLIMGFRLPLSSDDKAILLPLLNPFEMVMMNAPAIFGDLIYMDLGGRGIRGIDYWHQRRCFIICANSVDETPDPAYYLWSGNPESKPRRIQLPATADQLTAESTIILSKRKLLLLSDDGKIADKKKPKFRSLLLQVS